MEYYFLKQKVNKEKLKKYNINNTIKGDFVRLIEFDGKQKGIVSLEIALELAKKEQLDLVEIQSSTFPPICRIMDYQKFIFLQDKKNNNRDLYNKKKVDVKEIRIRSVIDPNDYQTKLRQIKKFIKVVKTVKITIKFNNREFFSENNKDNIVQKIEQDLLPVAIKTTFLNDNKNITITFIKKKL